MASFAISDQPLDCAALSAAMADPRAGAFASFEGWVRNSNDGHDVTALAYEVFHELAIAEGQALLAETIDRFNLVDARAVHREGALRIGDCAVWIGVTARHRGEAFDACRYIIDEIKQRLPVWKKEHYVGLEPLWVNCQHHPVPPLTGEAYYARQTILPEIGQGGQDRLSAAKILVVGVGGLGAAAASALAAAGIGTITLADPDTLSTSNLHRQTIYNAADIGKPKAALAVARLRALNPLITVEALSATVDAGNVADLFDRHDIVLDCTDNFAAKYLLNDAAIHSGKPLVQASLYRFEGQLLVVDRHNDAGCLRCLFPAPPPPGMIGDCAETGVLGTVPVTFGTLQANEAIKIVLGLEPLREMLILDLLSLDSQKLVRTCDAQCAVCNNPAGSVTPNAATENVDFTVGPQHTLAGLAARFHFVDVRETAEVQAIPGPCAAHLPMSDFAPARLGLSPETPLLVFCAKGGRSQNAAKLLRAQGWRNAYSLVGGVSSFPPVQNR